MALVRKLLMRVGGIGGFLATTDSNLVAANTTTDTDFTATIGRKADAPATGVAGGAVSSTRSVTSYVKQIVNLLLGTAVGTTFAFVKNYTTGQVTTGGVTLATATGTVFIRSVKVQGNAVTASSTGLVLTSNDATNPLCQTLMTGGTAAIFLDMLNGGVADRFNPAVGVGHQLATTKVLTLKALTASLACTGCQVIVEAVRLTEGATLA